MREQGQVKVYGSGLISSYGECMNVVQGHCAVHDFSLDEVLGTPVKVDEFQKVLFAIDSFDQMYEAMHEAEHRVMQGRL
jgi:phenylalanine-4-hydroxylase